MSIKIGSKIEKLNPADTYDLIDGTDVAGFDALKAQVDQHEADNNAIDSRVKTAETEVAAIQAIATGNTAAIQKVAQDNEAALQVMRSDVAQKISGLHVEDIGNHAFDDINALHFIGATVSDDGSQQATITIDKQRLDVSSGQTPGSTSVSVEVLEFPGTTITTRDNGRIAVVATQTGISGVDIIADGTTYSDQTNLEFAGFTATEQGGKLTLTPPTSPGGGK